MREIRVSPDGNSVAIRSDADVDASNAWGVMRAVGGGCWMRSSQVAEWEVISHG